VNSSSAHYGKTNLPPAENATSAIQRFGSIVELVAEKEDYYRELHANGWDGVMAQIKQSNIQNYSIYIHEVAGIKLLFSYF